ncbi:WD repeat-containing protein 75 [Eupeodes corollae]|uniref:WD repeat-containing protein 75 n=1 Tax=Eupeodes corollae TaxID=290404 RepID=UPI00249292B3|nr:WD repeat-containing protein 75 [Eupeodes corollae]
MDENDDKLKLQYLAGGSLIKFKPIFSPDSNLLFVVTDRSVQVFSVSTGQLTHVLEGAKDPLISLEYDLLDNQILVGCTEGGEVIRWKWATGTIRSRVQLKVKGTAQFHTFNFLKLCQNEMPCAVITVVKNKNPVQCYIVNSVDGNILNYPLDLLLKRQKPIVDVDKDNFKYFVIIQGPFLFFVDYQTWEWRKLTNEMSCPITCVRVHPKEKMIATGDEQGKIMMWRNFFKTNDDVRMTLYHWHHSPVTSIVFSATGASMYSSGHETVLVKWTIKSPELKEFVPRMSSIIRHIASNENNTTFAVSTADNGIQILGVDFQTKCTLQDFTYTYDDKTGKDKFPVGLRVNPRKNTLVLNGRVGHLQFYSAHTKTMLYNVDVVGLNPLCYETEKILYNTRVTQVAHNIDWMATAEEFNDEQHLPEVRLKFWLYNKKLQDYGLITSVEFAHQGGIRAIEFSNPNYVENLLCATVGNDNIIKLWSLEYSGDIHKNKQIWFCVAQTSYKNLPCESLGFCEDGSLLAAGFGNTLCVYKAENLSLLTALAPGGSFDGSLRKAQIRVPKLNKNGSKNDLNSKKQKIVQLFSNLLHAKDETLLKEIKNSVKTRKIREIETLDNSQKQLLYKKIRSMNQLNLFQKLLLYQKLGIAFQLNEEWHSKIVAYVNDNVPSAGKTKELKKQIPCLNLKSRFKAKFMINKYVKREQSYDQNIVNKLAPLLSLLKLDGARAKPVLTNGVGNGEPPKEETETQSGGSKPVPPMQSLLTIKKILFCSGDFAHLVIACTENRLLIWNLLNLRLQTVLKLSTEQIAIDSKNNLVAVFTKNKELHIFSPSDTLTLYFRKNMPRVLGAVWLPRKQPKAQAFFVNWQSRSILYFLTDNNEIMYLGADDDLNDKKLTFEKEQNFAPVKYSTFGTYAKNQVNTKQNADLNNEATAIGVHGKAAVKSFLEMSSQTMAPLSLLCNDFLKSVIELNVPSEAKKSKTSKNTQLNGFYDSSDNEDDDYKTHRTLIEKVGNITKKENDNTNLLSEEYLHKIAAETIEIDF